MRQERKVVTVLFCDLVGFTSQAEEMDPEDVAALLGPYQSRVKQELERYGGTVEKFIGDAPMALFGAPVAHEDDPERAVRAALAIRDYAAEEGIHLRIGVTTGEALVNLDARPDAGETMATGDVVNTAARLQAAAPVNGILVSEKTYEATRQSVQYREAEPVEAKGKAQPVQVWEVVSAAPLADRAHTTPLVGREHELDQLRAALARAAMDRAPQLVTLVGEPGIGKSRLVHEVSEADGGLTWLKGRCLPYGDGVSFWALAEIIKAHLGILESDSAERAEERLASLEDAWVAGHLRTLLGIGEEPESLGDRRAEAFAAWRQFLTGVAEEQPLALVIEDVQWADDGLLDFVTHLVDWAEETPLLVLCTARPELAERRPGWGGSTVSLSPLSHGETSVLLATLGSGEAHEELVERTGGNPLYAEQYARLLDEGGSLEELPTSVQGIIAARLDSLSAGEKRLVQLAAVIGGVFWSGAMAALADVDRWSMEERLLELERRELVHRVRPSSVEGETEYAFAHEVLRDVAYGEIPRAERAAKHRIAAQWIESLGRSDDRAEVLAHHYLEALELTSAAGGDTTDFEGRARVALRGAGDRASALHSYAAAARFYDAALDLPAPAPLDRARLLLDAGRAHWIAAEGGAELLEAASDEFRARNDPEGAAEAERFLAELSRTRGEGDLAAGHVEAALALIRGRPPSPAVGRVLGYAARHYMVESATDEAVRLGTEALSIADSFELDDVRIEALNAVGTARMQMGDMHGRSDLERSIEIGQELNSVETVKAFNNLGAGLVTLADLREAASVWDRGREFAKRFGEGTAGRMIELNLINQAYWSGAWDDALELSEGVIAESEAGAPHRLVVWAYDVRGRIRLARGDLEGAFRDSVDGLPIARRTNEPTILVSALAFGAAVALPAGRESEAPALADELLSLHPARRPLSRFTILFDLAVALTALGRADALLEETAQAEVRTRWIDAAEAYARLELGRAAELYAESGALPFEAWMRLKAAEQLMTEGRPDEAAEQLEKSRAFWRTVGATRYIRQCEELLAKAG